MPNMDILGYHRIQRRMTDARIAVIKEMVHPKVIAREFEELFDILSSL
jgi:hypothetical protein